MNPQTASLQIIPTLDDIAQRIPHPSHAHATAWVVNVMRTAISEGALTPGTKLSEQDISQRLHISRNTLRQAFMILGSEHLVEQIPNRGVFIQTPNRTQIREMFLMRLALESAALELAPVGEQPHLQQIITRSEYYSQNQSVSGMALANQEFHRALVVLAGSSRYDEIMNGILAQMRLLFFSMVTVPDFHSRFVELNKKLLYLVERGHKDAAQIELRTYLKISENYFSDRL